MRGERYIAILVTVTSSRRDKAGFAIAFALLLAVCLAAVFQTYSWQTSAARVSHTWDVTEHLSELALASIDAEGAARGLAVHFNREDAQRCRGSLGRVLELTREVRRLTADSSFQQANVSRLEKLVRRQDALLRASLESGDSEGMIRALDDSGRAALSVNIAALTAAMQAHERMLLEGRSDREQLVAVQTRRLFECAAALSFLLIALTAWRASVDLRERLEAERSLAQRDEQYRQVVEMAGDIIYRTDRAGRFTFCNQTSMAMMHLTEREVIGRSYLKLIRPDYRKDARRFYLRQAARKKKNSYYEFPLVDGHGRERWIGQNAQLLMDGDKVIGFQAIAREITEHRRAEEELEKSRAFIERIAATTPGILYVYDLDDRRNVYSNREVISVLGFKPEEIRKADQIPVHPDDLPAMNSHYEKLRAAADGEIRRLEYRARHADGHWVWLASSDTPFQRGADGAVKQIVGIAQDITSRKVAQEKLAYQANYDALTGLANRHYFWTRLQSVLRRAAIEHATASLCILDLDLFKEINDRFGHAAGDEVLEAVGVITRSELRSNDVAARLGGDEFCFVLPETDRDEAARVADRIRERLGTLAFGIAGGATPFSVTATFGIAQWTQDMEAKELMEAADRALYRAKSAGRNRVCVDV